MAVLTFDLDDDYTLIGIHSTEEDYKLAYILNKHLNFRFTRYKENLDFKTSKAEYPLFEFKDDCSLINYYLINNKYKLVIENKDNEGLFGGNYSTLEYLLPEKKRVDYFLKIEGSCNASTFKLVNDLNKINQIITSYTININDLKSKDHLIF
ncbi:hypothetical protein SAMN05444411_10714 [Lutibacter oricola]|uniref:IPExxxVDY family protein n=1 Tax=Lutibacter oricola TaxID=762486 RepID=A0A1H3D022_9FLAO|nr:IPExxxVDY family protein [Lutibacter oricola]SDX59725.1 hypothetical protein SAMN05444411_10714 [Lutibacter oricola]